MIRRIFNRLNKILYSMIPKKNWIVFESVPDLSDNTKAVFDEMIKRKLNDKYTFVWWVSDKNKEFPKYKNTIYIDTKNEKEFYKYVKRAKVLISCNQFLISYSKGQKSFYLTHGTAIKNVVNYNIPSNIDYNLVATDNFISSLSKAYKANPQTFYGLGFPRNDDLMNFKYDLHKLFNIEYKKIIVWYPTFRQHKNGYKNTNKNTIPILDNSKDAIKLNKIAKDNDILIVIKPHFAQDISYITKHDLSNLIFINDDFFVKNKISSYQFVGNSDALITDYSSIYFDYLLCDKPIGVVWNDIDEYRENPGFCIDIDHYMKGADKIYNLEDLEKFVINVSNNIDNLKKERKEICKFANYKCDGKNSERVVNFIVEKGNL